MRVGSAGRSALHTAFYILCRLAGGISGNSMRVVLSRRRLLMWHVVRMLHRSGHRLSTSSAASQRSMVKLFMPTLL